MKRVVARDSQVVGAYDDQTLHALLSGGTLKLTDVYWDAGRGEWRPLLDFIEGEGGGGGSGAGLWRQVALLVLAAAAGSVVTWFAMRTTPAATQPLTVAPGAPASSTPATSPETTPKPAAPGQAAAAAPTPSPSPAGAPKPEQDLEILSIESFDDEVAVTLQNHSANPVDGLALELKYFELPRDQIMLKENEAAVARHEEAIATALGHSKEINAVITALKRNLQIASADVITWTPAHIAALPTAEQWRAFGDAELEKAGLALNEAAATFAKGADSTDPEVRKQALTEHLLSLARKADDLKPVIERLITNAETTRGKFTDEISNRTVSVVKLEKEQPGLRARAAPLMDTARNTVVHQETAKVDAVIPPGQVKRVIVSRRNDPRVGVTIALPGAKVPRTTAASQP